MDIYEAWLDVKMSSIKGSHDPKSYRAREIVQDFIEKFVKLDKEIQLECVCELHLESKRWHVGTDTVHG